MTIEEHVPLAPLTTFRLGGEARYFARVSSVEELTEALAFAEEKNLKTLLLGGGSNMLVGESGFDGLVIKLELAGIERTGDTLVAAAGEPWDAVVERAVQEGLWGLENLSAIPGSVGAAPVQNIGAYGSEAKDTFDWLEAYDVQTKKMIRLQKEDCSFGYRTSIFKRIPGRYVILRVAFALSAEGKPNASYKDLAGSETLSLADVRKKVIAVRTNKFPDLSVEGTAGSFFLNPIVSSEKAAELLALYPQLPHFPVEGGIKIPLAWLLDHVLEVKGLSVGGARLFEHQPLVVAASRDAASVDVEALVKKVSELVKNKFGIDVEPEVRII